MAKQRIISKDKVLQLLVDIAEDDESKDSDKIRALQQVCLMEGFNDVTDPDIDYSKIILNFGKPKRN